MHSFKRHAVLAVFLVALHHADAAEAPEIEAQAVHEVRIPSMALNGDYEVGRQEFKNFSFCLYLKNVGQHVLRLPTEPVSSFLGSKGKIFILGFVYNFPDNPLGLKTRVADSKLGVVSLKPGETTTVNFQVHVDEGKHDSFEVIYEVPKEFAAAHDLWSGKIVVFSKGPGKPDQTAP